MNSVILTLMLMLRVEYPECLPHSECGDGWRATKGVQVYDCKNGVWERNIEEELKAVHRTRRLKRG